MRRLAWQAVVLTALSMPVASPAAADDSIFWDELAPPASATLATTLVQGSGIQVWLEMEDQACQLVPYHDRWQATMDADLLSEPRNGASVIGRLNRGDVVEALVLQNNKELGIKWRQVRTLPRTSGGSAQTGWVKAEGTGLPMVLKDDADFLRVVVGTAKNPAFARGDLVKVVDSEFRRDVSNTFRKVKKTGLKKIEAVLDPWIKSSDLAIFDGHVLECRPGKIDITHFKPDAKRVPLGNQPSNVAALLDKQSQGGGALTQRHAISGLRIAWDQPEVAPVQERPEAPANIAGDVANEEWTVMVKGLPHGLNLTPRSGGCQVKAGGSAPLSFVCRGAKPETISVSASGPLTADNVPLPLDKNAVIPTIDAGLLRGLVTVTTSMAFPLGGLTIGDEGRIFQKTGERVEMTAKTLAGDRIGVSATALPACKGSASFKVEHGAIALDPVQLPCARITFPAVVDSLVIAPRTCATVSKGFLCPVNEALTFSIGAPWESVVVDSSRLNDRPRSAAFATVEIGAKDIRLKVADLIRKVEGRHSPCDAAPAGLTVTEIGFSQNGTCRRTRGGDSRQPSLGDWDGQRLPDLVCWKVKRVGEEVNDITPIQVDLGKPLDEDQVATLLEPTYPVKLEWGAEYRSAYDFEIYPNPAACSAGSQRRSSTYLEESKIATLRASACAVARIRQDQEVLSDCAQGELRGDKVVFRLAPLAGRGKRRLVVIDNGDELRSSSMVLGTVEEWAKSFRERVAQNKDSGRVDLSLVRGDGSLIPLVTGEEWRQIPEKSSKQGQDSLMMRLEKISFNAGRGRVAAIFRSINAQYQGGVSSVVLVTARAPSVNDGIDDLAMMHGLKKYYDISVISPGTACDAWRERVDVPCYPLSKANISDQLGRLGGQ